MSIYRIYYTRRYDHGWGQYTVDSERIKVKPVLAALDSSLIFPRRSVTPDLFPTIGMRLNTCDTIEGRPNVKTEHGAAVGERRSRIVVNDVSDFIACLWTMDDPVVSVEWRLGAGWSEFQDQETDERRVEENTWGLLEARW